MQAKSCEEYVLGLLDDCQKDICRLNEQIAFLTKLLNEANDIKASYKDEALSYRALCKAIAHCELEHTDTTVNLDYSDSPGFLNLWNQAGEYGMKLEATDDND